MRLGRSAVAEALLGGNPQVRRQELRSIPALSQLVRDRYLPHAQATKRSWKTDEYLLRIHILPAIGGFALHEITSERIAGDSSIGGCSTDYIDGRGRCEIGVTCRDRRARSQSGLKYR